MPEKPFLSVVVPAYNEERRIGTTLDKISRYLTKQGYEHEIIVINDGSADRTGSVVADIKKKHPKINILETAVNMGKGHAVRSGMLHARGEYILFSDADLSTPIEEVEKLLQWIRNGYDIAIASRGLAESVIQARQPWYRETMGKIFNKFVRFLLMPDFRDTQCGFKCFRHNVAKQIFSRQTLNGFSFDVEVLWLAQAMGYRIKEVPASWYNEKQSRVHPIIDAGRMLADLVRLRISQWREKHETAKNHPPRV
jgi:dolichyl-phosphate beta-glucosyltransferase